LDWNAASALAIPAGSREFLRLPGLRYRSNSMVPKKCSAPS